jgi:hypothetical protein
VGVEEAAGNGLPSVSGRKGFVGSADGDCGMAVAFALQAL